MAFGPMSVGSEGAFSLITDQTLTKENVAADAKAAGEKSGGAGKKTVRKCICRPMQLGGGL